MTNNWYLYFMYIMQQESESGMTYNSLKDSYTLDSNKVYASMVEWKADKNYAWDNPDHVALFTM